MAIAVFLGLMFSNQARIWAETVAPALENRGPLLFLTALVSGLVGGCLGYAVQRFLKD